MKKGKKKVIGILTICIVSLLILIQLLSLVHATTISKEKREAQKLCVSNVTTVFDTCTKTVRVGYTYSKLYVKISTDTNKQKILRYSILLKNFNLGLKDCKDIFKTDKQKCYEDIVIPPTPVCTGDTPEKDYISNKPTECMSISLFCPLKSIYFADSCGCGCKVPDYNKKCKDLESDIKKERENIRECKVDSDCVVKTLEVPCVFDYCYTAINKNISTSLIEDFAKEYTDNDCTRACSIAPCESPGMLTVKCVNKKCTILD